MKSNKEKKLGPEEENEGRNGIKGKGVSSFKLHTP